MRDRGRLSDSDLRVGVRGWVAGEGPRCLASLRPYRSTCGSSVIFGFLLAADQQTLLFLAPVQLRVLFAVLVGALTATACICADLNDPFRGAFQITPSSEQLLLIRDVVGQTLECGYEVPTDAPAPPPVFSKQRGVSKAKGPGKAKRSHGYNPHAIG